MYHFQAETIRSDYTYDYNNYLLKKMLYWFELKSMDSFVLFGPGAPF